MTSPNQAHTAKGGGRVYKFRDLEVPSVTDILGRGVPKPWLTPWSVKMTAEWAVDNLDELTVMAKKSPSGAVAALKQARWETTDKAAKVGDEVHDWAEQYALGNEPDVPDHLAGHAEHFKAWWETFTPTTVMTEQTVYSPTHGYAGTFDAVYDFDGYRMLVDIKSGKSVYGEVCLQLAAYRFAEWIGTDDGRQLDIPEVDGCGVLHVRPRGCKLIPVTAELEQHRAFLYVAQVAEFMQTAKNHMHPVVTEPPVAPVAVAS